MLYALYKCIDVREIQKGKSMKRKKSTQLLAVALTAAMLAQPVGAQMVFAEGNADAVQQEQAVSPAAETTRAVLKSGTAVIPANADLNQVKEILGKTLVENADQVNLSSLEWEYKCEGKTGLTGLEVSGNESWGSIGGFTSSKKGIFGTTTTYTHPSLATNKDATYHVRLKGTTTEVTLTKTQKLTSAILIKDNTNVNLVYNEDGSINFDELGRIIEDQIAHGTDAIVICGTTGECSTMTDEEQLATIKYTVDVVNHRVPVIAGAGSNDTDHGCALAAKSAECGADALLMVTPYYNKTSQAGLVAHFTAMAEAGGIPVIVYNVPSRTGLNIAPETALELSKHPLINGIKEASGNISQVAKIAQLCGDELNIYSGNDDQVVPLLSLGGKGVISVVSNVKPELVHNCCKAFFDGDTAKARQLQLEMLPLADALFCEVNPIPVKYAMNVLGWEAGECRLPLVEPSDAHKEQIEKALRAEGLIKE